MTTLEIVQGYEKSGFSKELKEALFELHSHAGIENDVNPEQIVYRHKDVYKLILMTKKEYEKRNDDNGQYH